jgi:hypothetical protein
VTVVRDHPASAAEAVAGLKEAAAAYRDYGERHGTLHPAVWRELEDCALPQAALPACCGGLEWPAPQILEAVRQVALADPAAGWVAAICGPAGAFLSRLDPRTASELAGNRRDCDAGTELSRLISFGGDAGRALIFAGESESIGIGFGGWQVEAKRARRGCLTAPSALPEGDLIGMRLSRDLVGQAPRPGRCLLNTGDGKLVTVTVPAG